MSDDEKDQSPALGVIKTLERLAELEKPLRDLKIGEKDSRDGNPEVTRYHTLLYSLPQFFSLDEVREIHNLLTDSRSDSGNKIKEEIKKDADEPISPRTLFESLEEVDIPPALLRLYSLRIILEYHRYLKEVYGPNSQVQAINAYKKELKEKIGKRLKETCSPETVSALEAILDPLI